MIYFSSSTFLIADALLWTALLLVGSVSVQHACAMATPSTPSQGTLAPASRFAVVGVGVLGTSLCHQLMDGFPNDCITGITKTSNRHDSIRNQILESWNNDDDSSRSGLELVTMNEIMADGTNTDKPKKFTNVVFCAPPSGFEDYPAAVEFAAKELWEGPNGGGNFVFTSSGAIYGAGTAQTVNEKTATVDSETNPRAARLLFAERACLQAGGCCLRLAGLYNLDRGAHNFWLTKGEVTGSPDGIINLLHYEDAAGACVAALKMAAKENDDVSSRVFLVSDGHPMTRREICESALQAKLYNGKYNMPTFPDSTTISVPDGASAQGKIYDGAWTNQALNWKPKYESFDAFMKANA